jgi:integrase
MNKITFNKQNIEALPIPEYGKRAEYWDIKTPSLQVRVTNTGVKTFSVKRRVKNGAVGRITIGQFPAVSVEQARRKANEIIGEMASGQDVAATRRTLREEPTFSELFDTYVNRHAKVHKITWKEDVQRFNQYLKAPLGSRKLSTIARADIASIHSKITEAGHSIVANRVLALVSTVFGRGIEWDIVTSNPTIGVRRNKEKSRERFMQADEMPRFFTALDKEQNEVARDFILLALLTGARRAKTLTMRWEDVNFERREWYIERNKNGTSQAVTLSQPALEILSARKEQNQNDDGWVFPSTKSKTGHLVEPRKVWERIKAEAGFDNLRIHDLRRTLGSWQARTGSSLAIIGKSLNHKSIQSTAVYARLDNDPVRESVEKATAALLEAGGK